MPQKAFLPYASKIIDERLPFLHGRGTTLKIVVKWRWLPRFFFHQYDTDSHTGTVNFGESLTRI